MLIFIALFFFVVIIVAVAIGAYFYMRRKKEDEDPDFGEDTIKDYLAKKDRDAEILKGKTKTMTVNRMQPRSNKTLCVEAFHMLGGTASLKVCDKDPRFQHQRFQYNGNDGTISSPDKKWCMFSVAAKVEPKSSDPNVKSMTTDNTNGAKIVIKPCSTEYGGKWILSDGQLTQDNGLGRHKCIKVDSLEDKKDLYTWYCDEQTGTVWDFSPYTGTYTEE